MCLALYGNGMLRLWNLMDARCIFKKKVGLEDEETEENQSGEESSEEKQTSGFTAKLLNNP